MSRLKQTFSALKEGDQAALITFITAGDPDLQSTVPLMHDLVSAGADIIELGVPFSDPMADGPVIQAASERALAAGAGTRDVLEIVQHFRQTNTTTPVVLMGYLNPIEIMGHEAFASQFAAAGVDGMIIVDLPPEEGSELNAIFDRHGIDTIKLLAPTSTEDRIELICANASGFVYYVALRGVTGSSNLDPDEVAVKLAVIKQLTDLPVGVGFGIDSPDSAARIAEFADAVIVGSALVRIVADNVGDASAISRKCSEFISSLSAAVKNARVGNT